jgi:hypothetical protein
MEDPKNTFKTVSAKDYDRVFTDKLYEISSNVGPQQLNSIINDNMNIEEKIANPPSNTTSIPISFFSGKKEEKMVGEGSGESEDETDTESATASESDILPEIPNQVVQNNNNRSIARPRDYVPKPKSEDKQLREAADAQMDIEGLGGYK